MKNFKISLRTEIILNMTILMLAMIVLVSILVILFLKKDIYLQKAEGSLELIQSLTNISATIINESSNVKSDYTKKNELRETTSIFFKNFPDIDVIIADGSGNIFYNSDNNSKETVVADKRFYELIDLKTPFTLFTEDDVMLLSRDPKSLFVYYPITKGEVVTGGIVAKFSLGEERHYAARSQSLIFLAITLDAILFILLGSMLLSRVIVKPVMKLVYATEKIAAGNLDYKVESFPTTEIDRLSASFNKMTKNLLESQKKLNEHVESLEKVNLELKQAKDEVLRSEKLASVGRLATGIAHEVGNPLGSIIGYLEILNEDKGADLDEYIRRINRECTRIDTIVRELLDYSRVHEFSIESIDINKLLLEIVDSLFHRSIFKDITLKKDYEPSMPMVAVDKRQMHQVITNMLINSADAMGEGGGEIKITTKSVIFDPSIFASTKLSPDDRLISISIHDSGTGIFEEDLDKVFDPFYTTKEPGTGTGLGLAISLRIVESFDGSITVKSKANEGTSFNIYLPVAQAAGEES